MSTDFQQISTYWKKSYGEAIKKSDQYQNKEQFKKMAALMAPGKSYYYIANFHTLDLEMISDSVFNFLSREIVKDHSEIQLNHLLGLMVPEEVEKVHRKEEVIREFMIDYIPTSEVLHYKVSYTYVIKDYKGKKRVMLHQATPLSVNEEGRFVHVFSIHTDISHLTTQSVENVSFIHTQSDEKSYYNVCTKSGNFDAGKLSEGENIKEKLSAREIEITKKLAEGSSADEIAAALFISTYTVQTHRKNILKKTDSKNTPQLVAKCLTAGIIKPEL